MKRLRIDFGSLSLSLFHQVKTAEIKGKLYGGMI